MMEYFHNLKGKKPATEVMEREEAPVLSEEDEAFFNRITMLSNEPEGERPDLPPRSRPETPMTRSREHTPPPHLPMRPQDLSVTGDSTDNNAQMVVYDTAKGVPLPDVPDTPEGVMPGIEGDYLTVKGKGKEKEKTKEKHKKPTWSFLRRDSREARRAAKLSASTDLRAAAEGIKPANARPNEDGTVTPNEAKKEEDEMTSVLEQLNLAAVNNRVFSVSDESKELMTKFTLVLKDLVHGAPTAYHDLESLITNSENQLQNSFKHLPPFLQKLIEQLPSKMTSAIGPEMMAAAAEKPDESNGFLAKGASLAGVASQLGMKLKTPNLKDLVTKPGAVTGMLKTIMNFLRTRFPAFMGMNVLWSLALFILLFVFWYCHKRGREVRLEKERKLTEAEVAQLAADIAADPPADYNPEAPTTTAPEGASIEEVRQGMYEAADASGSREDQEQERSYAPEGSLAKYEREKEEKERRERNEKEKEKQVGEPAPSGN